MKSKLWILLVVLCLVMLCESGKSSRGKSHGKSKSHGKHPGGHSAASKHSHSKGKKSQDKHHSGSKKGGSHSVSKMKSMKYEEKSKSLEKKAESDGYQISGSWLKNAGVQQLAESKGTVWKPKSKTSHSSNKSKKSKSHSPGKSKSHSPGKSKSHSPGKSKSHSQGKSKSHSHGKSKSHSPGKSKSHSMGKSKSHSPGKSKSHSPGKSKSHSPGKSKSHSHGKSKSHSHGKSKSHSHGKSKSHSHEKSKSNSGDIEIITEYIEEIDEELSSATKDVEVSINDDEDTVESTVSVDTENDEDNEESEDISEHNYPDEEITESPQITDENIITEQEEVVNDEFTTDVIDEVITTNGIVTEGTTMEEKVTLNLITDEKIPDEIEEETTDEITDYVTSPAEVPSEPVQEPDRITYCVREGIQYPVGSFTDPDDVCTTCRCDESGDVSCTRRKCKKPACGINYQKPSGDGCCLECADVCCTTKCPKVNCKRQHRFYPSDSCCPQCGCRDNGVFVPEGPITTSDQCDVCVCSNGRVNCEPQVCPATKLHCVDVKRDYNCNYYCPQGKTCAEGNVVIKYGEVRRVGKKICACFGEWFPNAFCASPNVNKEIIRNQAESCVSPVEISILP